METRVAKTHWHNIEAYTLESANLRVTMVPSMGAKIVSLMDLRAGTEWLIGPARPVKPVPYGAVFTDQDFAGWDEMFPTISACSYPGPGDSHGVQLPDHGEAWSLPWTVDAAGQDSLTLSLEGQALPYRLIRKADIPEMATLRLSYTLHNLSSDPMPYLWAAHPQFTCGAEAQVILPPEVTEVMNTLPETWGWGPPETRFNWPEATSVSGEPVRADLLGPPSLKQARKLFVLPHLRPAYASVLRRASGQWVRFEWDPDFIPYLGVWVDEGALNLETVAAPEPMTGWYDDLALAYRKGHVKTLPGGGTHIWSLLVRVGSDGNPRLETNKEKRK